MVDQRVRLAADRGTASRARKRFRWWSGWWPAQHYRRMGGQTFARRLPSRGLLSMRSLTSLTTRDRATPAGRFGDASADRSHAHTGSGRQASCHTRLPSLRWPRRLRCCQPSSTPVPDASTSTSTREPERCTCSGEALDRHGLLLPASARRSCETSSMCGLAGALSHPRVTFVKAGHRIAGPHPRECGAA